MGHDFRSILEFFLGQKTAEDLADKEFEESQRSLIECERMRDYYENMVTFHRARIASLTRRFGKRFDALDLYP